MIIKLPSYLRNASGRMEDLVLYNRYGKSFARRYVKPANPDTAEQRAVKGTFAEPTDCGRVYHLIKI